MYLNQEKQVFQQNSAPVQMQRIDSLHILDPHLCVHHWNTKI